MFRRISILFIIFLGLLSGSLSGQSAACAESSGTVVRDTYSSSILGQVMYFSVYLPPCYAMETASYPVIYLMHGSNEDDGHWQRLGLPALLDTLITSGEIQPLIVVMPFGNVIANRNRFDRLSWGAVFREELMPAAESRYRITAERSARAIGGISRGGFWAYQIALSHPDLFSIVGGHSAFFDRYHAEPQHNPLDLIAELQPAYPMRFWLDRGIDDFAAPGLDLMHERMQENAIAHTYQIKPQGEHNNAYWSQHIEEYVRFYAADWQEGIAAVTPAFAGFMTNTPAAPDMSPVPTLTATPASSGLQTLFPVVAFASLQTSINRSLLENLLAGQSVPSLLVDEVTAADLEGRGIIVHPEIARLSPEQLLNVLKRDRNSITLLPLDRVTSDMRILLVDDLPVTDPQANYPLLGTDLDRITRLTFSGVTALARNTRIALDQNGIEWAASGIQEYVRFSDFFHISNEVSAIVTCPQSPTGEYLGGANSMCTRPEHLELFDLLGVDIVELTGNHNADYGYDAYLDTLTHYRQRDFLTVGGGETLEQARNPLLLDHHGNRIAVLACNAAGPYYALVNEDPRGTGGIRPGAAFCDREWLAETIPQLAQQSDVLIVSVQYIEVEDYQPLPDQQMFFRWLGGLGADVVLGSAAHKPQTFEWVFRADHPPALIHHGLGNLYFDQPFWGNTRFFLDTFYVYDGRLRGLELYPGIIEGNGRPRLMTDDERFNFLYFMFVEQNGF